MSTNKTQEKLLNTLSNSDAATKLDKTLTKAASILGTELPTPNNKVSKSIAAEVLTEIALENQKEAREKLKSALKQVMVKKQSFEKAFKEGVSELAKTLDTKRNEINSDLQKVLNDIEILEADLKAATSIDEEDPENQGGGQLGSENSTQDDSKNQAV